MVELAGFVVIAGGLGEGDRRADREKEPHPKVALDPEWVGQQPDTKGHCQQCDGEGGVDKENPARRVFLHSWFHAPIVAQVPRVPPEP